MNLIQIPTTETVTMTSLEMVDFINSQRDPAEAELRHDNFMAKVPQVLGELGALNFKGTYRDVQNKERPCYRFPKREACLMAMSYSYDLQAKVFDRMTELERSTKPALPDFTNPIAAARAGVDVNVVVILRMLFIKDEAIAKPGILVSMLTQHG